MSVIVNSNIDKTFRAYVKGSPEKIAELCIKTTLPKNFNQILEIYTNKGYRVIALSVKMMNNLSSSEVKDTKRDEIECDLNFLGFIIMENKLKGATQ